MKSVFITGCNRGIGLQLVHNILKRKNFDRIFATARTPSKELEELAEKNPQLQLLTLDVTDSAAIKAVVAQVERELGENRGLNYLVNNAGRNTKSARLEWVTMEKMNEHLCVNVSAPVILALEFLPLLKRADTATIVNISSIMGSLTSTESGMSIPYRSSKAALNMATKCLSLYLAESDIKAVSVHPGWVRTDMGGPSADLSVVESADGVCRTVFDDWKEEFNGRLVDYKGDLLPW